MYLAHERYMCKSIHHMGSDRASCRMRIALGENHCGSGVTSKVLATWVLSTTAFALSFLRPQSRRVKRLARRILQLKMAWGVYGIPWFPVADWVLLIFQMRSIQTGRLCSPGWMNPYGKRITEISKPCAHSTAPRLARRLETFAPV